MISETKEDDSFRDGQFSLHGFGTPFNLDRNRNGGAIMLFIRNDIVKVVFTDDRSIESFYLELNFRKKKRLLICSYNAKHSSIVQCSGCRGKTPFSTSSFLLNKTIYIKITLKYNHLY